MPNDSEFPLLGIEPKEIPTQVYTSTRSRVLLLQWDLGREGGELAAAWYPSLGEKLDEMPASSRGGRNTGQGVLVII